MSDQNFCISVVAIGSYKLINYLVIINLFSHPNELYPTWEGTIVHFHAIIYGS